MKTITINLLGESSSDKLTLPGLDIDPQLLITAALSLGLGFLTPNIANWVLQTFMITPSIERVAQLEQEIGASGNKATKLANTQKEIESLESDYRVLLKLTQESGRWKDVFEELRDLTPTDMWFTGLNVADNSKLTLTGYALDYRAVAFFYTNLQKSRGFARPVLGSIGTSTIDGQPVIQFQVDCDLNPLGGS
ncbi:Fimbrial assembly protein (PilN) [compost metagenome]